MRPETEVQPVGKNITVMTWKQKSTHALLRMQQVSSILLGAVIREEKSKASNSAPCLTFQNWLKWSMIEEDLKQNLSMHSVHGPQ